MEFSYQEGSCLTRGVGFVQVKVMSFPSGFVYLRKATPPQRKDDFLAGFVLRLWRLLSRS